MSHVKSGVYLSRNSCTLFSPIASIFPVENTDGERFYRLYPITNGNGRYFMDLALDQPYDAQEDNLDNILITVTLE